MDESTLADTVATRIHLRLHVDRARQTEACDSGVQTAATTTEMLTARHPIDAEQVRSAATECFPLRVHGGSAGEPISFGVPLPRGHAFAPVQAKMQKDGAHGVKIPVQAQPLMTWSDGSVRWLLIDALLGEDCGDDRYVLQVQNGNSHSPDIRQRNRSGTRAIELQESAAAIEVDTGVCKFRVNRRSFAFDWDIDTAKVSLCDSKKRLHVPVLEYLQVETKGPIRSTVCMHGSFPKLQLRVHLRLSFFAGTGLVKTELTLHNPRRARHQDGLWDLGDRGSVLFEDLSVQVALPKDGSFSTAVYSLGRETIDSLTSTLPFDLYQDSSGGENWKCANHVDTAGKLPVQFRGYRLRTGQGEQTGLRASPVVSLRSAGGTLTVAIPQFWQQFPKAVTANADHLRVGLFPGEFANHFELQGGERKTHTVWLRFERDSSAENLVDLLRWVHEPAFVQPASEWSDLCGALTSLENPQSAAHERFQNLLNEVLESERGILANRERVDEYGWRNFGDVFADHEQSYYQGSRPLISHYNNQFDMVQGFLLHWLRTGDRRWFELGDTLARHVMDIDIYHTTEDRPAYNGGLFWFTDHYLHAQTSTHRTYSRANATPGQDYGGGPGAEHNFTTGLLHYHLMTGNPHAREAVVGLADWVIAMDDGRRTVLGVIDDGPTGLASATGARDYHGPGRAAGNSVNALLDAWELTRQRSYLDYAEVLVRRCIHPHENIDARQLLDVEKRWSYTIFLTALAKYLESKEVEGEFDWMYAYGQRSLLNYAEWMLENERPYFDQVEKLEYPTEAWAAQELRKANVVRLAAQYATEPRRSKLIARGEELAERAWSDLLSFDTRTSARASAIVMIEGWKDCIFRDIPLRSATIADNHFDFGTPQKFVPQKGRVIARLKSPAVWPQAIACLLNPLRWAAWRRARITSIYR